MAASLIVMLMLMLQNNSVGLQRSMIVAVPHARTVPGPASPVCDLVTTFSYLAHLGPGLIIGERNKLGLAPVQPSLSSLDSDKGAAKKTSCPSPGRARAPAHIKSRWLSPR